MMSTACCDRLIAKTRARPPFCLSLPTQMIPMIGSIHQDGILQHLHLRKPLYQLRHQVVHGDQSAPPVPVHRVQGGEDRGGQWGGGLTQQAVFILQ